ncbi:Uncharacterized protein Adt_37547 [Abeliophyllum distichum]|uniref:RNase H type-1 domain-containing protein n=1 Tax=Abeliophyllum distichum TaxID=126358 RepID=A0ABD1QKR2_9LAMI
MEFDYTDHCFLFLLEIVARAYTSGCGDPETDWESYGIETVRGIPVSLLDLEILGDSSGQCIRAFFSFYGDCTILEAELRALLDGIILARRLGLSVLWVESDSTLAIHCITKGGGPWHIQATLRHIRHLLVLDMDTITHIFRESNQVADLLASESWDRHCYYEYNSQDLPRRHRSLVQIDRFGLPTVRGL